jgi:hypothetical protein
VCGRGLFLSLLRFGNPDHDLCSDLCMTDIGTPILNTFALYVLNKLISQVHLFNSQGRKRLASFSDLFHILVGYILINILKAIDM